jgi:hypothetical protein
LQIKWDSTHKKKPSPRRIGSKDAVLYRLAPFRQQIIKPKPSLWAGADICLTPDSKNKLKLKRKGCLLNEKLN